MKPEDGPARRLFAKTMLCNISQDDRYLLRICFCDEATFHVEAIVNRRNVRIWRNNHGTEGVAKVRNTTKVNVHNRIIGPFFGETTVTHNSYLEMFKTYVFPHNNFKQFKMLFSSKMGLGLPLIFDYRFGNHSMHAFQINGLVEVVQYPRLPGVLT